MRVGDLARLLNAQFVGDEDVEIRGAAEPAEAGPDEIALAMSEEFVASLGAGRANVAILPPEADWQALGLRAAIFAPRPRYVLAHVTRAFASEPDIEPGIHPTSLVHPDAQIPQSAAIGPFCVIGARARIGENARIASHCTIARDVSLGDDILLHSGVRICEGVRIGARFVGHPGAVIGSDGFSFVTPKPGQVEEARASGAITSDEQDAYTRVFSIGSVVIGNDVELGANSCIDRGTVSNTVIGDGTKIDNQVQIGHNVQIGHTCLLCGQAGVAGSVTIGDRVVLGGKAGIADHVRIGSNVVIAGQAGVSSHVSDNKIMMGNPAVRMDQNVEIYKAMRRLPRLLKKLKT